MDNSFAVRLLQRFGNLDGVPDRSIDLHRSLLDRLADRLSLDKLHHDKLFPIFFAHIMNNADMRMIEHGSRLRFLQEARLLHRSFFKMMRKKLERDDPIQLVVLCFIDNTHASFANKFHNCVLADRFPDHN